LTPFHALVLLTTFLCSLVAGFLFAFAIVIMPGIKRLDAGGFIRAFQVVDEVIQNGQPLFMLMWVGSALAVIGAAVWGTWTLEGTDRLLLIAAAAVYIFGVQAPTATINLPLNNALQKLDLGTMSETMRNEARNGFESRWNRSNGVRTVCASLTSLLLLILLWRL
jgi:uncharacterized membrane protein